MFSKIILLLFVALECKLYIMLFRSTVEHIRHKFSGPHPLCLAFSSRHKGARTGSSFLGCAHSKVNTFQLYIVKIIHPCSLQLVITRLFTQELVLPLFLNTNYMVCDQKLPPWEEGWTIECIPPPHKAKPYGGWW